MTCSRKLPLWASLSVAVGVVLSGVSSPVLAQVLAQDTEHNFSGALGQINAFDAYTAGFTGQGVRIGVIDSGIDLRHPDFSTVGKFVGGITFTTAGDQTGFTAMTLGANNDKDNGSHGTFVSGFAAGARNGSGMQGVAYDANLFVSAINTTNPSNTVFDDQIRISLEQMVQNGVGIVNLSLGQNSCTPLGSNSATNGKPCNVTDYANVAAATVELPTFFAATQQAVNAGVLLVFATGNEGQPSPDLLGGAPALAPTLQRGFLAVGAVDANGDITNYSNRCGVAAAWCLVAPGNLNGPVVIGTGTIDGNGNAAAGAGADFKDSQGTSYAAPTVAGAAAVTKQAFSWYTNFDLQQTLLTTATAKGTRGATSVTPDAVYGWGLLNVGAAVKGYGAFVGDISLNTQGVSSTFSNNIFGNGNVTKLGAGTLRFTGINTYTGTTTVNGGTLQVDGTLVSSAATVNTGGTLSGIGTLAATTVATGGTLSPGNAATPLGTLSVNGPLVFQTGSNFNVTVSPTANSSVNLTGGASATLNGGIVQATFQTGAYIVRQYTLLSGGNVTGTFASLSNVNLPAAFLSSLGYTTTSVLLNLRASLGGGSGAPVARTFNGDQQAVAAALDNAFNAGGGLPVDFTPLFDLEGDALEESLDELTPQIVGNAQVNALIGSQQFGNDLLSCRSPGSDTGAVIREGQCLWAKARATTRSTDATDTSDSSSDRSFSFAAGTQFALAQNGWFAGAALGYDTSNLKTEDAKADVERFNAGLTVKYVQGPLQLAGGVSGGWGQVDTRRFITIPGLAGTMTGEGDLDSYAAQIRAAYLVDLGNSWYVKPLVDARLTLIDFGGLTEQGGPAALQIFKRNDWVASVSPALEFGSVMAIGGDASFRPFVRAGLTVLSTDALALDAQFAAVPGAFQIGTEIDRVTADIAAGFDVVARSGASLRVEYDGQFGENTQQSSVLVKGAVPF